jgi:hypothetical protein
MKNETKQEEACICRLSSAELITRKQSIIGQLKTEILEVREMENGFAYRFHGRDEIFDALTHFIKTERTCCPFFEFSLVVSKNSSRIWLELSGPEGVKEFIKAELAW